MSFGVPLSKIMERVDWVEFWKNGDDVYGVAFADGEDYKIITHKNFPDVVKDAFKYVQRGVDEKAKI